MSDRKWTWRWRGSSPSLRLLVVAATLAVFLGACGSKPSSAEQRRPHSGEKRLEHSGVSVIVPTGWSGRVLSLHRPGPSAILQLANFELPKPEGFALPAEMPEGEVDPIEAMSGAEVLISLEPERGRLRESSDVRTIGQDDFLSPGRPEIPRRHAVAEHSFCLKRSCFEVEVDFASSPAAPKLVARVNEVLSSVSLDR